MRRPIEIEPRRASPSDAPAFCPSAQAFWGPADATPGAAPPPLRCEAGELDELIRAWGAVVARL